MLLMHRSAEAAPVRLSSGILVSFATAVVHVALFCLGIWLGNKLLLTDNGNPASYAQQNAWVFFGLAVMVAIKQFLPSHQACGLQPQCGHSSVAPAYCRLGHQCFPTGLRCWICCPTRRKPSCRYLAAVCIYIPPCGAGHHVRPSACPPASPPLDYPLLTDRVRHRPLRRHFYRLA